MIWCPWLQSMRQTPMQGAQGFSADGLSGIMNWCSKSQIAVQLWTERLGLTRGRRRHWKHFAGVWRRAGRFLVANLEDGRALGQLQAAVDQVSHGDPAGNLGRKNDQREEILLALDQRFGHTVDRVAAANAARHLRNDEGAHIELGMLLTVTDQRAGDLFGGHQAYVGDEVAVDRVGQVDVEDDAGEVGAVVEEEVEVADVAA